MNFVNASIIVSGENKNKVATPIPIVASIQLSPAIKMLDIDAIKITIPIAVVFHAFMFDNFMVLSRIPF